MPSPFPGMNPYFEQADDWQDFHGEFLMRLRHELAPQVRPKYIVQLEKHVYIHDLPPEPRRLLGRPDVSVVRSGIPAAGPVALGVLEAPAEVQLPMRSRTSNGSPSSRSATGRAANSSRSSNC